MRYAEITGTRCFLSFNYSEDMVTEIKQVIPPSMRAWDGDAGLWIVQVRDETMDELHRFLACHFTDSPAFADLCRRMGRPVPVRSQAATAAIAASKQTAAEALDIPGLVGTPRPFQWAGIRYMADKKRCINADEMGLGKTVQAIATIKHLAGFPCLYVTRATLKENTVREWSRWTPDIGITQDPKEFRNDGNYSVFVTNYDRLTKFLPFLLATKWRAVVMDEGHFLKNEAAARTKAMLKVMKSADPAFRFALSGTPLDSRPSELWAQLKLLGLDGEFGNWFNYVTRYCEGHKGNFGWDVSGASHTIELYERLCKIGFIRRKKSEVAAELGARTYIPVFVKLDNADEYRAKAREIGEVMDSEDDSAADLATLTRKQILSEISGRGKMAAIRAWLADFHETPGRKVVAFAYHRTVQRETRKVMDEFGPCAYTMEKPGAWAAVDTFQNVASCSGIVCSLEADNAGHNMTAAQDVFFVEMGMKRSHVDQAIDRLHRIGQTGNVTAYFFIAEGTVEEENWKMHERKGRVRGAVADGQTAPDVLTVAMRENRVEK